MNAQSGNRHIDKLCEEYSVTWRKCERIEHSAAIPEKAIMQFPPFSDAKGYWAALHELGHCVLHVGKGTSLILAKEAEAWNWAFANALDAPAPQVRLFIAWTFGTYWQDCFGNSPHFEEPWGEDSLSVKAFKETLEDIFNYFEEFGSSDNYDLLEFEYMSDYLEQDLHCDDCGHTNGKHDEYGKCLEEYCNCLGFVEKGYYAEDPFPGISVLGTQGRIIG